MTKKEITQLSYTIIGYAIKVHKKLGPGLLEKIYEECLKYELETNGYKVQQQINVEIDYYDLELEHPLRLDLLVNNKNIYLSNTIIFRFFKSKIGFSSKKSFISSALTLNSITFALSRTLGLNM